MESYTIGGQGKHRDAICSAGRTWQFFMFLHSLPGLKITDTPKVPQPKTHFLEVSLPITLFLGQRGTGNA